MPVFARVFKVAVFLLFLLLLHSGCSFLDRPTHVEKAMEEAREAVDDASTSGLLIVRVAEYSKRQAKRED